MSLRAALLRSSFVVAFASTSGCGGSSSETPPPLPPHPLNEPYRVRGAISARANAAAKQEAAEQDDEPIAPNGPSSRARSTWGSTTPEPLPELAPR